MTVRTATESHVAERLDQEHNRRGLIKLKFSARRAIRIRLEDQGDAPHGITLYCIPNCVWPVFPCHSLHY